MLRSKWILLAAVLLTVAAGYFPDFAVFPEKSGILKKGMQCSWDFRKSRSRKLKCSA